MTAESTQSSFVRRMVRRAAAGEILPGETMKEGLPRRRCRAAIGGAGASGVEAAEAGLGELESRLRRYLSHSAAPRQCRRADRYSVRRCTAQHPCIGSHGPIGDHGRAVSNADDADSVRQIDQEALRRRGADVPPTYTSSATRSPAAGHGAIRAQAAIPTRPILSTRRSSFPSARRSRTCSIGMTSRRPAAGRIIRASRRDRRGR